MCVLIVLGEKKNLFIPSILYNLFFFIKILKVVNYFENLK